MAGAPSARTLLGRTSGFENGLDGWVGHRAALRVVDARPGTGAMRVTYRGDARRTRSYSVYRPVTIPVAGNVAYVAQASLANPTEGQRLCLLVREFRGGSAVGSAKSCVASDAGWQRVSAFYFTRPGADGLRVSVFSVPSTTRGTFLVDDIGLRGAADAADRELTYRDDRCSRRGRHSCTATPPPPPSPTPPPPSPTPPPPSPTPPPPSPTPPPVTASTNPVPPPASGVYWGARIDGEVYGRVDAPWDGTTWNLFEEHAGKRVSLLHFGHGASPTVRDFNTQRSAFDLVVARGALPFYDVMTYNVSLAEIAAGTYDTQLRTFAAQAAAWARPFLLRFNWEMNGTWFSHGAQAKIDPLLFVAVWRRFHDIAEQAGARNIAWVWCPNTEYPGSTPLEQLYPGDAYVDWTCIDGYNFGANPLRADTWMSFEQRFRQTYDHLLKLAPSKPIIIGETASTEYGGAKDRWIRDALATMGPAFPRVRAFSWFNWNIYEYGGRWDWPIESSAAAQRAFAEGIASSYYVPGS